MCSACSNHTIHIVQAGIQNSVIPNLKNMLLIKPVCTGVYPHFPASFVGSAGFDVNSVGHNHKNSPARRLRLLVARAAELFSKRGPLPAFRGGSFRGPAQKTSCQRFGGTAKTRKYPRGRSGQVVKRKLWTEGSISVSISISISGKITSSTRRKGKQQQQQQQQQQNQARHCYISITSTNAGSA